MNFKFLNKLFLKLKSYFLKPKHYGVNVICKRYSKYLDNYLGNSKIINCGYLFYGLKNVSLKQYPDFLVPFKIKKNKKYYLLTVYYVSIQYLKVEENVQHIIELFDNIESAQNAINYIQGTIQPTQHDILKMAENPDLSEKLNMEEYSFSVDSKGELTLIKNTEWNGSLKIGAKFVIREIQAL